MFLICKEDMRTNFFYIDLKLNVLIMNYLNNLLYIYLKIEQLYENKLFFITHRSFISRMQ